MIEPHYPNAAALSAMGAPEQEKDDEDVQLVNEFWSSRLRCYILIWREGGKLTWGKVPGANHIGMDLHTLGCAQAWGIEQEHNAIQLLGTMVRHHALKQYLLTGMFLETSERSGITYLFRRLKPTVAIDARPGRSGTRILACLCLHPIGYYSQTWAGAMCPTDDVVAHLTLMRGDEHLFWKRSNQIPPSRPEAGL